MLSSSLIYYPRFNINAKYGLPESLKNVLLEIWNRKYSELYEEKPDSDILLEEAFSKVLNALWNEDTPQNGYKRYAWIAYSLGLATQPTVESYLPDEQNTKRVLKQILQWLKGEPGVEDSISENLFPEFFIGSQAIDEAIDVFRNLQIITNPESSRTALLEILDDCIEGYAIFPGSEGKRDLFNWWLLEVVPAAWKFQSPHFI